MKNQLNLFEFSHEKNTLSELPASHLKRQIKIANSNQITFTIQSLDDNLPLDHQARTVWNFVEQFTLVS